MTHDYPGNIRELENIIEHAFVLCPEGQIKPDALPDFLIHATPTPGAGDTINSTMKSVEAQVILDSLKRNKYNRLATARELGMHKSTLFRKIKTLGIYLPKINGRTKQK